MNQNQRYEVLMHFPGYEGSPCGMNRGEYAANRGFSRILRMTRILGFGFTVGSREESEVRSIDGLRTQDSFVNWRRVGEEWGLGIGEKYGQIPVSMLS